MRRKTSQDELEKERPWLQWLILGIAGTVLLVAVSLGGRWLFHKAEVWRARGLVKEATALLEHPGQEGEAESKLTAASTLAPDDLEVLRNSAADELKVNSPRAAPEYYKLIHRAEVTREDQRGAVRAYIAFRYVQAAQDMVNFLMANNPQADDYALESEVRWLERSPDEAIAIMRQSLALAPDNRANQLLFAQMLVISSKPENGAEALPLLQALAQGRDAESLGALILLSRDSALNESTQRSILDQLRQHPLLDDQGRFAAWELELRLGTRTPETIWEEALASFQSADPARKAVGGAWLYNQHQPELALKLATPPDTMANPDLMLVRLNSLSDLKRWSEVEKELEDPQVPLALPKVFLYRARAAAELGDEATSHTYWERARTAASADYPMLAELADYALKMGKYDEAKATLVLMTQAPGKTEASYMALIQVEAQHGSTAEFLATLKRMRTDLPLSLEAKNDWAYLTLLTNADVDEAAKLAQELVAAHPEVLAYRSTLALGYLRHNNFVGAEKVYEGQTIDWGKTPDSWKMVYAVVLGANGHKPEAQAMAREINRVQLRPEESALLNMYVPGS